MKNKRKSVLRAAENEIRRLGKFSRIHVVSSPNVWRALGQGIARTFSKSSPIQGVFTVLDLVRQFAVQF